MLAALGRDDDTGIRVLMVLASDPYDAEDYIHCLEKVYALEDIADAARANGAPGRRGKVLLRP